MEKLEKIDLIRERLGVSYAEASMALEEADGDVVAALVKLEKEAKAGKKEGKGKAKDKAKDNVLHVKGQELIDKIKEIIKEGNANRIIVKNDEKTLVEIPVTAGVVSLVLFPYITLLGGMAALYKDYTLEIEKEPKEEEPFDPFENEQEEI